MNIEWQSQAFGEDRYFSELKYAYRVTNINRKKDYYFKVTVYFNINDDIRLLVDETRYQNIYELKLKQRQ